MIKLPVEIKFYIEISEEVDNLLSEGDPDTHDLLQSRLASSLCKGMNAEISGLEVTNMGRLNMEDW